MFSPFNNEKPVKPAWNRPGLPTNRPDAQAPVDENGNLNVTWLPMLNGRPAAETLSPAVTVNRACRVPNFSEYTIRIWQSASEKNQRRPSAAHNTMHNTTKYVHHTPQHTTCNNTPHNTP